jgi:23S rRNA (adenine2503-C2)-methyltransferase
MIKKLADDDVKVKLAVSLHSAIDEIRSQIMPFSKISLWLIYGIIGILVQKNKSKISYEYVVWKILMTTRVHRCVSEIL